MLRNANSYRFAVMSLLMSFAMVFVLACGGSSESSTEEQGIDESESKSPPTDENSEENTASEATSNSTAAAGSEGITEGPGESETLPTVGAGEECVVGYEVLGMVTLFTANGVCQNTSDPCVGGTPDMFDLGNLLTQIPEEFANLLPPPADAAANCESGLICCINQDQCQSVSDQISGNAMVAEVLQTDIACVSEGTCTGDNPQELMLGCPEGQGCCVNISFPTPPVDGGTADPDAGI